jgi:7-cyano-7-deazaguanine synthase in queuosine biosynthesis
MGKVILLSGGMDSYITYTLWHNDAMPLFVSWGAPYEDKDYEQAKRLVPELKQVNNVLDLWNYVGDFGHVPHRNVALLTIAAQYGDKIVLSGVREDLSGDTSDKFLRSMSKTLSLSERRPITVFNGTGRMTKTQLLREYFAHYGDLDDMQRILQTRSCYRTHSTHCGECAACLKRWVALTNNGVAEHFDKDPREYARAIVKHAKWRDIMRVGIRYLWEVSDAIERADRWDA